MTPRERVLAILNREPVDRFPVDIWHTDEILQLLKKHFDTPDDFELYHKMGIDKIVWVFAAYNEAGQACTTSSSPTKDTNRSMWGTQLEQVESGSAMYQEFVSAPLSEYDSVESLDDYPYWPDVDHFDYQAMAAMAKSAHQAGFATLGPWVSFFEIYCQMRGLETALMDLLDKPDYVEATLDRIEECQTRMLTRFLDTSASDIDMVFVSDDMGSQGSLLMSIQTWDRHFQARMKRWCNLIHSYDLRVFYHTDGAAGPLIPRLIDTGIDILNPIQHVCPGMETAALKQAYGDRIVFHGGIENQKVLPFGSTDDVRNEVLHCLGTLGQDQAGYIVCSCHNVQPGTPVENVLTMVETVHQAGRLDQI